MCRLLCVKSPSNFPVACYLKQLSEVAQNSKEYQGHGWGYAIYSNADWKLYHNIKPIWEDNLDMEAEGRILLAHARSAFENKDVRVENNMPFRDDKRVYVFNGELRGVRINEQGRIGAEKLYNFIKRFERGSLMEALSKAMFQLEKRTKYIKAVNMVIADAENIYIASKFNEDPEYYTLYQKKETDNLIICSEPFKNDSGWQKMSQGVYQAD